MKRKLWRPSPVRDSEILDGIMLQDIVRRRQALEAQLHKVNDEIEELKRKLGKLPAGQETEERPA